MDRLFLAAGALLLIVGTLALMLLDGGPSLSGPVVKGLLLVVLVYPTCFVPEALSEAPGHIPVLTLTAVFLVYFLPALVLLLSAAAVRFFGPR